MFARSSPLRINAWASDSDLSESYLTIVERYWRPLAHALANLAASKGRTLVVGLTGLQGCGKSTAASAISELLANETTLRSLVVSLDDLYLTRAERAELAHRVHPLLATRGPPGTHDLDLGLDLIERLRFGAGTATPVPRFDKARDERVPITEWSRFTGPADVLLIEGWCLGLPAEHPDSLARPVNKLETEDDAAGVWRNYCNRQLAGPYQDFFAQLDCVVALCPPSFDHIRRWRLAQERQLRRLRGSDLGMDDQQVERFIMHFERLSRHALGAYGAIADAIYFLDPLQHVRHVALNARSALAVGHI